MQIKDTTELRDLLRAGLRRGIVLRRDRWQNSRQFVVRTWTASGDGWTVHVSDFDTKLPHRWQVAAYHWDGQRESNQITLHRNVTPRIIAAAIAALDPQEKS